VPDHLGRVPEIGDPVLAVGWIWTGTEERKLDDVEGLEEFVTGCGDIAQ
jgi:hypothetical protein